jgi:hypothetical protein
MNDDARNLIVNFVGKRLTGALLGKSNTAILVFDDGCSLQFSYNASGSRMDVFRYSQEWTSGLVSERKAKLELITKELGELIPKGPTATNTTTVLRAMDILHQPGEIA